MSAPYDCFEKIIGLADSSCDCFTDDLPADTAESASGLQLAGLEGMNLNVLKAAADCATGGDLGALLENARVEGIRRYKEETLKYIRANARVKRPSVRGQIGDTAQCRTAVSLNNTHHGLHLRLAHHVGGTATVKRIGTFMEFTGTVDVNLYGIDGTTATETVSCATTAGTLVWTTVDIDLSLEVNGSQNPEYWFLWEPTGGQQARNSRIHCGCGGRRTWNETPWFESGVKANDEAWMKWAMAHGTKGNTLADRDMWTHTNETQGLLLDIEFGCEAVRTLCDGYPDYTNDPLQMSSAYAVRYAAGSYIISTLLASTSVSRETLTGDGENYYRTKAIFEKGFYERAHDYIGATLVQPPDEGDPASGVNTYADCFACKEKSGFRKSTITR